MEQRGVTGGRVVGQHGHPGWKKTLGDFFYKNPNINHHHHHHNCGKILVGQLSHSGFQGKNHQNVPSFHQH